MSTRGSTPTPGKPRQLLRQGFATKRTAEQALAEAVGASARGMAVSRSTIKLDGYLDEWFAKARQSLRPTTTRGYAQSIGRLTKLLVTLDLYSHVVPSLAKDAAEQIMSATYGEQP